MRRTRMTLAIVAAALVVAGCGKESRTTTGSSSSPAGESVVTLSVADRDLAGLDSALSDMDEDVKSAGVELTKTES